MSDKSRKPVTIYYHVYGGAFIKGFLEQTNQ